MRIDSPKMTNAEITGSFSGSFTGEIQSSVTADSVAFSNITGFPNGVISGSATQARSQLGVVIGTDVQAYADNLNDIAGLNATDGNFIVGNGSAFVAESGATVRTSLGLGSFSTISSLAYADLTSIPSGIVSSSAQIDNLFNVDGLVSGSTLSSAGQGSVTLTTNGVAASAVDLGLETGDSPTFAGLTVNGAIVVTGNVDGRDIATDGSKLDGIEASADVTDTANVTSAGALMDSEVTSLSGIKTLTVPDSTTISSFGASLVDDADAAAARTTLGVDAAGTDNSTDVTLAGTPDYITISGQTITRNQIDLTADVTGDLPISEGGTGASTAAAARSNLGVDAAGTDNSTDVTLAGSRDYITISGQEITVGQIDISDDTNLAVSDTSGQTGIDMSLTGDTLSATVSGLGIGATVQFANLTVSGDLTVSGTTTSINSTNLDVTDKLIAINRGGSTAASADGGGLFISGANESLTWDNGNSRFTFSDDLNVGGNLTLSGTVDGRDVASDGSKLDGIESGATADQTAAEIRTLVESASDSNVFTDADHSKLDGIEAGADVTDTTNVVAALTAGTNVTIAGDGTISSTDTNTTYSVGDGGLTQNNFTDALKSKLDGIAASANNYTHPTHAGDDISIDTGALTGATVISDLDFNVTTDTSGHVTDANGTVSTRTLTLADLGYSGDTNANYITNNNQLTNGAGYTTYSSNQGTDNNDNVHFEGLMVGQTSGATANTIRCVGDIVAYYSSDSQFKDNVEQLDGALDKLKQIRGVRFDWNDKQDVHEGHDIGVIAQEVEAVYPELVHERDYNNSKAVDYVKLTAVLIEAVKELSAKVDELENKCNC